MPPIGQTHQDQNFVAKLQDKNGFRFYFDTNYLFKRKTDMNEEFSTLFYVMLLVGIVGLLGFLIVAAGAVGGF